MSDYKFMLESHLTAEQSRVLATVQRFASEAGLSVFLSGGAMRDMMGGFPIRDLDFTIEGNALKLAKSIEKAKAATVVFEEELSTLLSRWPAPLGATNIPWRGIATCSRSTIN